jgi:hypothetical protein
MDRRRGIWIVFAAVGLALCLAAPAEAAKSKNKKPAAAHAMKHRHSAVAAMPGFHYQRGVRAGPLYNGQDYLGDDPDPNIRSYLIRDMSRYGGVD